MDQFARPVDLARYESVRAHTEYLASCLTSEDQCIQSMPDASPAKWHRAHTTWFFEQFILVPHMPGYQVHNQDFQFLFNSYYESVGARHPRPLRGMITRPAVEAVTAYRAHVDEMMREFLGSGAATHLASLIELGLQHEQQHQELLVTDITHAFAQNPLAPAAMPFWQPVPALPGASEFVDFAGGLMEIGYPGEAFCFDNETPRHRVWLEPYRLADQLVRNRDWLDFIADGGYRNPLLWMSEGWAAVQAEAWRAPLYWREEDGWHEFGPAGLVPLDPDAPARHFSWYEAEAFARWSGARLPTEAEWEAASADPRLRQMDGCVWQWTASAYLPYPGFNPVPGAVGEYNGKFMINQMVLRGGSAATSPGHARPSYRNFFHPDKRWQFTGLRLARNS